jgi:hypothetical protein
VISVGKLDTIQLALLALLTTLFILLFPRRKPLVDLSLAAIALVGLICSARYTKKLIWAASPPPASKNRLQGCLKFTALVTLPAVLVFVFIGVLLGYRDGGWPAVAERMFNWRMILVFAVYVLWPLIQQTLFQFYLMGRLLALSPKGRPALAVCVTGIAISLVHWPDVWTVVATAFAGICGVTFIIGTVFFCRCLFACRARLCILYRHLRSKPRSGMEGASALSFAGPAGALTSPARSRKLHTVSNRKSKGH